MTQRSNLNKFWRLVDEALESRTVYDTIHILKLRGRSNEEIKEELRQRHGLNELQTSQALREYREIQEEESI